jgi:hypothetical protein
MSFVFGGWSDQGSFCVRSTENALSCIRVSEDAFSFFNPLHGGLNIDDGDKSSRCGSQETEEKGVRAFDSTDEIVLRPKGILVRLAGSSRLGAYDAVRSDFLELSPIQDMSPVMPHPVDIGYVDSLAELGSHCVSPQMLFINLRNRFLVLPYLISQI